MGGVCVSRGCSLLPGVLFVVCRLSSFGVAVVLAGVCYWSRLSLGLNVCRVMVLLDVRCLRFCCSLFVAVGARCYSWFVS